MEASEHICECEKPGFCPFWGTTVSKRRWQICSGNRCNERQRARDLTAWLRERDKDLPKQRLPKWDETTEDNEPFDGRVTRHLAFHVMPVAVNGLWQWNVDQIVKRLHLFNGVKVISIVTPQNKCRYELDDSETVLSYCRELGLDFDHVIIEENDTKLREVKTFLPMMDYIHEHAQGTNDITFCCHAKGVTHTKVEKLNPNVMVQRWAEVMYDVLLDGIGDVEQATQNFAFAGCFRRFGNFKTPGNHQWHYSGTFYWMRNCKVFREDWRRIDPFFYGTESWPGLLFPPEKAACMFLDHSCDLYTPEYWRMVVIPELAKWKSQCGYSAASV